MLGPRADATLSVRYDDRRFHFPTDGSGVPTDRNAYTYGDALTLNLNAGRRWTDAFETRLTFDVNESDRGSDDAPDGPADTLGFFGYSNLNDLRRTSGGVRAESNERFGTAATWKAGAAWQSPSERTCLRLAAGTGIKEPTFFETYATGFTTGNPDLEPEHSTSFEAGLDQDLGSSVSLSLTGFSQSYRDLIQYTFSPPTQGGPNYHNEYPGSGKPAGGTPVARGQPRERRSRSHQPGQKRMDLTDILPDSFRTSRSSVTATGSCSRCESIRAPLAPTSSNGRGAGAAPTSA